MAIHHIIRDVVEFVFTTALFTNAILFIPQTLKIFKEKDGREISLITFGGFLLIQFTVLLHGIIENDILLIIGYGCSMLSCGSVVVSSIFFRNKYGRKTDLPIIEVNDPKLKQELYVKYLKLQRDQLEQEIKVVEGSK